MEPEFKKSASAMFGASSVVKKAAGDALFKAGALYATARINTAAFEQMFAALSQGSSAKIKRALDGMRATAASDQNSTKEIVDFLDQYGDQLERMGRSEAAVSR